METCKQACLKNCLCKLALFRYKSNASSGDCVLLSDVFSIINNEQMYYLLGKNPNPLNVYV